MTHAKGICDASNFSKAKFIDESIIKVGSNVTVNVQVRQKALIMAEMMSFQQKRQDEDYKLAEEIEDLNQELSK